MASTAGFDLVSATEWSESPEVIVVANHDTAADMPEAVNQAELAAARQHVAGVASSARPLQGARVHWVGFGSFACIGEPNLPLRRRTPKPLSWPID